MQKKKSILITGGAGYIGSHTVVELLKAGYTPVVVDNFSNSHRKVLEGWKAILGVQPQLIEADVCNEHEIEAVFQQFSFDGIIHFAAYKAVGESVQDPLKYYHNNIQGLVVVCRLALKYKVMNFVFSSSCTVYGEPENAEVFEQTPLSKANSPYGNTKLIGEQLLHDIHAQHPAFNVINLRYFNPVGAHPSAHIGEFPLGTPNNLLPFVTQTAIGKREKLTVFGNDYPTPDGTCIRDYIHVCDLAMAHLNAIQWLQENDNCFEAINIGTGKGTSVLEIIACFEKISGVQLNWAIGPRRAGDVTEIFANAQKSNEILHWNPNYTIEDAVEHAWKWELKLLNDEQND